MTKTPQELHQMLEDLEDFLLLDVRTEEEYQIARIQGAELIPLNELEQRLDELDEWLEKPIVVLCHHGVRSASAQRLLRDKGFEEVYNLAGGIDAYAAEVDPRIARYD